MIEYQEALECILALARQAEGESVALMEACGRVLAQRVEAPWALPRFDNSAMDGFAVHGGDVADADRPVRLRIVGESAAGAAFEGTAGRGEAIRISTGAELSGGPDTVIPIEKAEVADDGASVVFREPARPGQFVRRLGSDVAAGSTLFSAGTRLTPEALAMLAYYNIQAVSVFRRPRVGILTSGNEIVALGTTPTGSQIIGSSLYYLQHTLDAFGCETRVFGIAPDDRAVFLEMFEEMLEWSDIAVTTAGVSVGEHDVVGRAVADLGGQVHFWRVRVRPGKPMLVATFGDKVHFGFPGNPVSTCCNTELFLKPFLRRMFAMEPAVLPRERMRLGADCPRDRGRLFFVYARIVVENGERVVHPLPNQNSGNLLLPARANGLIKVDHGEGLVAKGSMVEVVVV